MEHVMPVTDLQPGQYIYTYHDSVTGSRPEVALNYFRVERVSNHFVWLVWEFEADHSFRKKREWIENNFYPVKPESYRPRIKLPPRTAQSKKVLGEIRLPDGRSFAVIYCEDAP